MPTLYVTEPGARVEKDHGRLQVTKEDEVLASVPLAQVSEVVLVGGVGVTTPAMLTLLENGCGLTLITSTGHMRGRLRPAEARNVPLRQKQYRRAEDEKFCLAVSQAIVAGKLRNCRTLARRMARPNTGGPSAGGPSQSAPPTAATAESPDAMTQESTTPAGDESSSTPTPDKHDPFARMNAMLARVPQAKDLAELRGLEGMGAKAYFSVLRAALRAELTFDKRTRRPPRDPANALLSLLYSLLTNALFTAAEVVGLDAYAGYFHADKYGRPALALDLVEEFRPIVADSVVLWVVNKRMLKPEDFTTYPVGADADAGVTAPASATTPGAEVKETPADNAEQGVRLSRRGLRVVLGQFSRRLQTEVYHPGAGRALTYQKVFEVQARALRKCIETGEPNYQPFLVK